MTFEQIAAVFLACVAVSVILYCGLCAWRWWRDFNDWEF